MAQSFPADFEAARDSWRRERYDPAVARVGERRHRFSNSFTDVAALYGPDERHSAPTYLTELGFPGQFPFTRGIQPSGYRGRLWTMRQYAGFGSAAQTNQKFRTLMSMGQTGLSLAFDLPTQLGYDSDDPLASDEVGRVGVAIDSLADMEAVFDGIPLDGVSTSMTMNAPAAVLLAMYIALADRQGVDRSALRGTVQNDVLKEYAARGAYIFPPQPSLRLAADVIDYCARELPRFNAISVSGYHIREAGSSAAQEMAFTLANGVAYVEATLARGLSVDDFAGSISWIFNTHNGFLEEVAKFRALRRLWATIMRDRFGAKDPRSMMLRTHTQTGGSTLTAQQSENNVVRAALQTLAAVLGGVQSIALSCYDEALALPTDQAQRLALRTQQIIAHESGVADTIDPLAGSYAIETLTNELEAEARDILSHIEAIGGAVSAVEQGYVQREIANAAAVYQREIESGDRIVVGVNKFVSETESNSAPIFRADPDGAREQRDRLDRFREYRDAAAATASLTTLRHVARAEENVMPALIDAVNAGATLGEVCLVFREEFGEYVPNAVM